MISQLELQIATSGRGTYDVTAQVQAAIKESGVAIGMCNVFIRHTSASLMLCENADPAVRHDLESFMSRLAPDGDPMFTHTAEGPDDMPAHVRSVLTQSDLNLPVRDGRCDLGTWQGIYLWEHRHAPHERKVTVTISGE
ncbi:MAG: YjbQ family protein [Proteobacteria bacterium]|nr:YjbQ family protein [Pseudomonadota bacterium]